MRRPVVGHALERRAHSFVRQFQPEEDGLAGAITRLANRSGIDDDGTSAARFERFVERDSPERADTVEETRPMSMTEDTDIERSLAQR
jgi:2-polyprenyl-6-methoxyphenol hydroxylase-like FAD-dependent oxidoreductase